MKKYGFKCMFPGCPVRGVAHIDPETGKFHVVGVEYSHIIFRSTSKELIDDPDNGIPLCPDHHRLGPDSVHRSQLSRVYFHKFLPERIKKVYNINT